MTSRMSFGSTMMLGMVGCDVCIQTCKAVAVIPVVSATCLKRGAWGKGDFSSEMPWQVAQ